MFVMCVQGVNRPLLNKVCRCEDNWGDYGCQLPVQTLSNNDTATVQVRWGVTPVPAVRRRRHGPLRAIQANAWWQCDF